MRMDVIAKLLIAAFAASLWSAPASANTKQFWINNKAGEKVKVCAYHTTDTFWVRPITCNTVPKAQSKLLIFQTVNIKPPIKFRVFRPAIFDKLLCQKRDVKITDSVVGFHILGKDSCLLAGHRSSTPKRDAVPVRTWKVDDKVLVNWESDAHWWAATITRVNPSNTYNIRYADGSTDTVAARYISGDYIQAGTKISGNWLGKGRWYPGVIASRDGNTVKINYDDGDKETTTLSKIRLTFGDLPEPPKRYMMRVCNNINERVFFAISFSLASGNVRTEGWWNMNPNSCINVDMSKRWKLAGLPEDKPAATYIYGETVGIFGGAIKKTWEGEDAMAAFCVNKDKRFYFKNQLYSSNTTNLAACKGPAKERVMMAEVDEPRSGTQMRFNFDGR